MPLPYEYEVEFKILADVVKQPDNTFFAHTRAIERRRYLREGGHLYGDELEDEIGEYILPPSHEEQYRGVWKGVQGDMNSCYMDASVFAMFSYLTVFDEIVKPSESDQRRLVIPSKNSVQIRKILRETIVSPLRK